MRTLRSLLGEQAEHGGYRSNILDDLIFNHMNE